MLRYVRVILRLIGFGLISLCSFLEFCLIGHWLKGDTKIRYQGRWLSRYSKAICWLLDIRVKVIGKPAPAAFLIANHMSYVDPFVMASQIPVVFVAKSEIRDWPWGGILTRCGGSIYLNREQRTGVGRITDQMKAVAHAGVAVGLFLEGTTSNGDSVLPFHPGLLQPAIENKWNVLPCTLNYRVCETGNPEGVAWYGDTTLLPHLLNYLQYPYTDAIVEFSPVVQGENRKTLTAQLHREVSAKLEDSKKQLGITR